MFINVEYFGAWSIDKWCMSPSIVWNGWTGMNIAEAHPKNQLSVLTTGSVSFPWYQDSDTVTFSWIEFPWHQDSSYLAWGYQCMVQAIQWISFNNIAWTTCMVGVNILEWCQMVDKYRIDVWHTCDEQVELLISVQLELEGGTQFLMQGLRFFCEFSLDAEDESEREWHVGQATGSHQSGNVFYA